MEDFESEILSLSDDEIVLWWKLFGECPHPRHRNRLRRLLATRKEFRPGEEWGPPRAPFTGREAQIAGVNQIRKTA